MRHIKGKNVAHFPRQKKYFSGALPPAPLKGGPRAPPCKEYNTYPTKTL